MRKIIHIDMDAFYASIEQRDDPSLRGQALAVGGQSARAVVMTASYEARQFGVKSAMPVFKAKRLCDHLLIVRPRFDAYKAASRQLHEILKRYSDQIEPLALDEAYLDVSANPKASATDLAALIRQDIENELNVTASAGISFNKFLAKLASGMNKPDAQTTIKPSQALAVLADLPISRFHGVGPKTAAKFEENGLSFGRHLQELEEIEVARRMGRTGIWARQLALGIDDREVEAGGRRKSLSVETTFSTDLFTPAQIKSEIASLVEDLCRRREIARFQARTLTLKLKFDDFTIQTRSQTRPLAWTNKDEIIQASCELLDRSPLHRALRLIGVGLHQSNAVDADADQLSLPLTN